MKNILHTIDVYGSGGAEQVFLDLIFNSNTNEFNITVVVPKKEGWLYEKLLEKGVDPLVIDMNGSFNFKYLWALIRIIKSRRIDVVQSHLFGSNLYASIAGFLTNTPVVCTFHGAIDIDNGFMSKIKSCIINFCSSKVVYVSNYLRKDLVSRTCLKEKKSAVIYNGIDLENKSVTKGSRRKSSPIKSLKIGMIGNINEAKAYTVAVNVLSSLRSQSIDARIFVAGERDEKIYPKLKEHIDSKGLGQMFIFSGYVEDIDSFFDEMDIYLITSDSEGLSLSTIEAMRAKKPVVATKCGGPEEIVIDGKTGFLCEKKDVNGLAERIILLFRDEGLRNSMIENAELSIKAKFDLQVFVRSYADLYRELLA